MNNGRPLFPGTSDADQLDLIFKNLGTPDETTFRGISELPDYKVRGRWGGGGGRAGEGRRSHCRRAGLAIHPTLAHPRPAPPRPRAPQPAAYKRYAAPESLAHLVPGLPPDGVDLFTRMLQHDPARRITAVEALGHPFFADLPPHVRQGGMFGGAPAR